MSNFLKILCVSVLALSASVARAEIGTVQFAIGDVRLTTAQGTRAIAKGDQVNEGDTLTVGSGSAQIKMVDGGYLAVRPDTQMKFDQYKWAGKEDGTERGLLSLVRGGFRSITGALGRINKENFKINTPTATVGIRGTDHEIIYIPPGTVSLAPMPALLAQAGLQLDVAPLFIGPQETLVPMLLAQAGPPGGGPGGGLSSFSNTTLVKNNVGISTMQQRVGGVPVGPPLLVNPNQVGAVRFGQAPSILPPGVGTNILRATAPPRPQAPAQQQQQQQQQQGQQGQQGQGQGQAQGQQGQQGQGQGATPAQAGESTATAAAPAQQQAAAPAQQQAEPIRATSVVDSPTQVATASQTATQSSVTSPVATTVVTVSPVSTGGGSSSSSSTTSSTTATTTPVVLTSSSGLTVNTTSNTVTSSTGTATPISQGAFATQADAAAAAAFAAHAALNTLVTSAGGLELLQLPTELSSASALVTPAQTAFNAANALAINTATPTATAASALATTNAATAAFTANGAFADATLATPAKVAMLAANTTVQSSASSITSLAATLGTDKTTGGSTLNSVTAALTAANNALTTLTSLATALGVPTTTTAQGLLTIAQNASNLAASEAAQARIYQDAGNFTAAQAELTVAQQQQTIAVNALSAAATIISGIASAQAAKAGAGVPTDSTAAAGTVYGYANDAQAVAASAASLATTVASQASVVNAKAPIAQYSNPAVAAPQDGFGFNVMASKTLGAGQELVVVDNKTAQAGNNFVLDGAKSLINVRTAERIRAMSYDDVKDTTTDTTSSPFPSRYVTFTGGTANETFKAPDNSMYLGRWQGGNVNIFSDTGTSGGTSLLETIALGSRSAHWLLYERPPVALVPKLIGTSNYALLAATKPTDIFGNAGTLNSATLTANFTALTATANVNLSFSGSRTLTLNAQTPDMAIVAGGFQSIGSVGGPTVTCTGAGCIVPNPAGGSTSGAWGGGITGGFGTSTAYGAGLSYSFSPNLGTVPANTPNGDLIEGVAALTAGVPTIGANPTPVGSTGQYRSQILYGVNGANSTKFLASNSVGGSTTPTFLSNTGFVVDATGKLVHVLGAQWNAFGGNSPNATQCLSNAPCLLSPAYTGASPSPYSTTLLAMGGGAVGAAGITFNANSDKTGSTAAEYYNDAVNGLRFGRYQGGFVNATNTTDFSNLLTSLGSNSVLWAMREIPSAIPVSGAFQYVPTFATAPTDNLGNVGVLNYATLSANFSRQTVDATVSVDIAGASLRARGQDVPIGSTGKTFDVGSATTNATLTPTPPFAISVSCFGTCPALPFGAPSTNSNYSARIQGGFAGDTTAGGAFFRYTFNTYYDPTLTPGAAVANAAPAGGVANQFINGYVGFNKGPQYAVPAGWGNSIATSFFAYPSPTLVYGTNDFMSVQSDGGPNVAATFTGPSGNFNSITNTSDGSNENLTIGGVTTGASTVTTPGTLTGISFGRYDAAHAAGPAGPALTLTGNGSGGTLSNTPALGAFQWIAGPNLWPIFYSTIAAGTASYSTAVGSAPTDQNGTTGTFSSATLSVDFNRQSVATSINLSMPANTFAGGTSSRAWSMTGSNIALSNDGGFNAGGNAGPYAHRAMTVLLNGGGGAFGNIQGQLTGAMMSGAIMSYAFAGNDPLNAGVHEHVNGVIGFGTPTFTATATNAAAGAAQDPLQMFRIRLAARGTSGGFDATTGANVGPTSSVGAAALNPDEFLTRTVISAEDWTRFKFNASGQLTDYDAEGTFVSGIVTGACPSGCSVNKSPVRLSINAAGTAASASAYGGAGSIPAMPAISSGAATIAEFGSDSVTGMQWGRYTNGNFAVVDRITGGNVGTGNAQLGPINHFILGPVQSGPSVLPTTGTFTYTRVGNTSPTDNAGSAAGVLNTATLIANFGASTPSVNASIDATVGGRNWTASASNMKILAGTGFEANKNLGGGGSLNVNCTGTGCVGGQLAGSLTGAFTGPTGQGAGIAYSLNTGGVSGITMGGVVAFKR